MRYQKHLLLHKLLPWLKACKSSSCHNSSDLDSESSSGVTLTMNAGILRDLWFGIHLMWEGWGGKNFQTKAPVKEKTNAFAVTCGNDDSMCDSRLKNPRKKPCSCERTF